MTVRSDVREGNLYQKKEFETLLVIYKDIFDFKALYEMMHEWLIEEGFRDDNGDGKDAWETFYWERRKPGTDARDFTIWWRLMRPTGHAWWRYDLNIHFTGLHIGNTEVMHNGQKVKLQNGEIDIFITPVVTLDPSHKWKKGTLFDRFLPVFKFRLIKKDFSMHKAFIEGKARALQEIIKDFLELKQFGPRSEPFHGKKGLDWDKLDNVG